MGTWLHRAARRPGEAKNSTEATTSFASAMRPSGTRARVCALSNTTALPVDYASPGAPSFRKARGYA